MIHYRDRLSPWCIIRLLPNLQRVTVGRFRRRSDAEAQIRILRLMVPTATYTIVFDVGEIESAIDPTKHTSLNNQDALDWV
jgi:hypothetical protein